jgi:hypothetical protein
MLPQARGTDAAAAVIPPGLQTADPPKGDRIDRLASLFQRARLWRRRERRRVAQARAAATPAACAALARYRRACRWERVTREAYLRAVFAEYC